MSYGQGYRQPPRRHYQEEYYGDEQQQRFANPRGQPTQQGDGRGQLNRHASQPDNMNVRYRKDGVDNSGGKGGGGGGLRFVNPQSQQLQRPPPLPSPNLNTNSDSAFPAFLTSSKARAIPVPPGSIPIDDAMLSMNLVDNDGGNRSMSMPRQRGPPPPGGPPLRAQTMQSGMRGKPVPNFTRGSGRGGMDPRYGPPPEGMRGPPPRILPPRSNISGRDNMPGRGGFPPGHRLPVRQHTVGGYDQGRGDPYQGQYNSSFVDERRGVSGPQLESGYTPEPGYGPPQRSITMPPNAQYQQGPAQRSYPQLQQIPLQQPQQSQKPQQQQYMAYNPAQHGPAVGYSAPRTAYAPPQQQLQAPLEEGYNRESVGALLDEYYNEPDYTEEYGYHQESGILDYYNQAGSQGHPADPYQGGQNGYIPESDFAHQAHRTRSHQDLRGQGQGAGGPPPPVPTGGYIDPRYQNAGHYDGAVEMPAEVPAEMPGDLPPDPPIIMTANGFPPPPPMQNIPMVLRVGSPAPGQQMRRSPQPQPQQPLPQQQAMAHPPRGAPAPVKPTISPDSLPVHPSPASTRFSSDSGRYSHPDSLPAHPPPIRPGLLPQEGTPLTGHPPPRRQYSPDQSSLAGHRGSMKPPPITQIEFNQIQQAAKANPGDQKLQLLLAKKMVEAAAALADEGGRADAKTTKKNRENWIFDAHKIVKKLANSSRPYSEAMFYLAECYWEGLLGLQVDHERAFNLYQSAAKLNHAPSAYRTAVCCELGAGTKKDPLKSMTWYKKASALGDTAAMYKLGMIMLKGLLGQTRNGREAINWLKRAADQADENNPHALHQLGLIYEQTTTSDFVIPDANYARELFMKAAELGYPPSQFRLGCSFEYGTMGCPIDPMESITWYSRAAMQGEEESALALSGWYLTGAEGVIKQSDIEAYLWARKAAEKGLANAEYALGYFTEVGIGVAANLDEAKRWYFKAASQKHEKAMQRLHELKRGGSAVQKSRERLSRSNVKNKDDGDCVIM